MHLAVLHKPNLDVCLSANHKVLYLLQKIFLVLLHVQLLISPTFLYTQSTFQVHKGSWHFLMLIDYLFFPTNVPDIHLYQEEIVSLVY